ncbi:MAG: sigma-54-dependent Fis family transcriptional regulator [Acidobacteria bacterium]|nr:sigma-54-dependent Fis family transcriptional regulator [Acidobacteriota bacterium]
MSAGRILIVDDEPSIRELLSIMLEQEGYETETAESVATAGTCLETSTFDLVICDLKLPDGNGLDVLLSARRRGVETRFVIITAHTTPQNALEALRAGAVEYLSKPFEVEELKHVVAKHTARPQEPPEGRDIPEFIGNSPAIRKILDLVPRFANTPSTVLITGESGTGKELLARAIHGQSSRATGPFLSINCGALPEGLLESELFGHVRGAFTGAVRDNPGLFAQAANGTLFLDEVGELTPAIQVKLLRVLQEHRVRRVGGSHEIEVDVRIMAATNRNLEEELQRGAFREDLYYRLNVLHLHLPPLRARRDDIPDLARHFVDKVCRHLDLPPKRLTPDAVRVLLAYPWPGNVRELENIIERTVALEPGEVITAGSLPETLRGKPFDRTLEQASLPEEGLDLEEYLDGLRRSLMRQALNRTGGQQKRAAELLRMSYRSFRYHAKNLGLTVEGEPHETS